MKFIGLFVFIAIRSRSKKGMINSRKMTSKDNMDDTSSNLTMPEYLADKIKSLKPQLLIRMKEAIPIFKLIDEYYQDRIKFNCRKFETHHVFEYQFYHSLLQVAKENNAELKNFRPELVKQITLIFEESKSK